MSRKKSFAIIALVWILHFGLMMTLFISRMSCGMQSNCASGAVDVLRDVLAFPLNVITLLLDMGGINADDLIRRYVHGEIVLVFLLNSLVASLLLWYALVKPLMKAVSRRRSAV